MAWFELKTTERPACKGMGPELFVGPDGRETRTYREVREHKAKMVCRGCPVVSECLEWALEHNEVGVWGGLTEDERRSLKRRRSRQSARGEDGLTSQQRARLEREEKAWRLYCVDGLSIGEIAKALGVSSDTAYDYIRTQRRKQREESEREESEREARHREREARKGSTSTTPEGVTRYVDRPEDAGRPVTSVLIRSGLV